MLIDNSDLDYAIAAFFNAADSGTREEIVEFARKYGVSSVRRLYEWSSAHADFDLAADINFTRGSSSRTRLQVAPRALRRLKLMIEETSETTDHPQVAIGRLAGLDTDKRSFHLVVGGDDIEGIWADTFVYNSSYLLDQTYMAGLTKRVKVHYALEKEEIIWLLKSLDEDEEKEIETDH